MKWAILSLLFTAACLQPRAAEPPKTSQGTVVVKNVGTDEFEKLRGDKKNVVLDVRTPKEYTAGHMPGAVNIDFNAPDFDKKIATLDTNKTYLVHCAAGVRSAKACNRMSKLSFAHLVNLEGGMKAWEKAGHKAEQ